MFESTEDRAAVIQESIFMHAEFKYRQFCTKVVILWGMRGLRGLGLISKDWGVRAANIWAGL